MLDFIDVQVDRSGRGRCLGRSFSPNSTEEEGGDRNLTRRRLAAASVGGVSGLLRPV
jgi:hypothetical protein